MKRIVFSILVAILAFFAVTIGIQFAHDAGSETAGVAVADQAGQLSRGAYLTRAGDCMACHTVRGGQPYAGGRAIATPFGTLFTPNITPDLATGIGSWSSDDFWRTIHNGKSKDGSFLYPAFPYTNYTKVSRPDSDAMFAYFRTLKAVRQPNQEHALRFPYNQRLLLAGWRALYFRPETYRPEPGRSPEWNRGAYLVQGLGHCSACHSERNALGATSGKAELGGGVIPMLNWHASDLTSGTDGQPGDWQIEHISDLLKTGVSQRGAVFGPMAEVVRESLQHLSDSDIRSMAIYLKSLPQTQSEPTARPIAGRATENVLKAGAKLYEKHCVDCHQAGGEGVPPAYPPLSGKRSLTVPPAINPIRMVLNGGYPPSVAGNPRPYGMPPFAMLLNDTEVAAVVSYIRNTWGHRSDLVSPAEVNRYRSVPVE